jgi:small multidrug resistance pump
MGRQENSPGIDVPGSSGSRPINRKTQGPPMNHYIYISLAVGADAAAASALKAADGFKVPVPSLLALAGYGAAFFFLSQAVRTLPVGVANALWSGLSVIAVAMAGYIIHRQALSLPSIFGLLLICGGTTLLCADSH